jgi:hypothetical protein
MIKSNCSDALLHDVKQTQMVALSAKKSKKLTLVYVSTKILKLLQTCLV